MKGQLIRAIHIEASRLSTAGRMIREDQLEKMDELSLRALLSTLRDAQSAIDREKRVFRPFPGGPRIRM